MADTYANFAALAAAEDVANYEISSSFSSSKVLILTPHGGGIEIGTTELVKGIAGTDHDWYLFEGKKLSGNSVLHITSSNFDEPTIYNRNREYAQRLAIHGAPGTDSISYIGGKDKKLMDCLYSSLLFAGFDVVYAMPDYPNYAGDDEENIVNRNRFKMGAQIELSTALRQSMFDDYSSATDRWNSRNDIYYSYVEAVQKALNDSTYYTTSTSNYYIGRR